MKKAISAATSAALLASLLATAVAPSAFAAITVGSAGNVPVGGTSANNVSFTFTEQSIAAIPTNLAGSFTVTITPNGALGDNTHLSFTGTPSTAGSTGSLGATASIAGNVLTVKIAGSDLNNVESIFVTGLKIKAATGTPLGAIVATLSGGTGSLAGPAGIFSAGGTASGFLATGVAVGDAAATVNVTTTPGCPFVTTAGTPGTFDFAAGIAGTSAESLEGTASPAPAVAPAAQVQTLTIKPTTPAGFASAHNAGDLVTQVTACGAVATIASPGTVVAAIDYESTGNATVFPGELSQSADRLTVAEPSAGFLAAASTFTFKILTAGVVFTTAPSISWDSTTGTLSAPVISADRLSATVTVKTASTDFPTLISLFNIKYDVAASVPAGTFISVGLTTSAAKAVLPADVTNAVVFRGIAASAPSPTVFIGENNQAAGLVTLKESAAGFFTDGVGTATNLFEICPIGVDYRFTLAPVASVVGGVASGNLILRDGAAASTTNIVTGTSVGSAGCYSWTVWTASTTASTIVIGAAPSAATGALINVTSNQAPGGVNVDLFIGTSAFDDSLAATVQFATAVFRNQVAVTAVPPIPFIAPGSANAAVANIQIAETGVGQLKNGENLCFEILWRSGVNQDTFMNSLATADLPIATASGTGLVISPVSTSAFGCSGTKNGSIPGAYMQSFSFTVLQQSTAGDGKVVIGNMRDTTLADAPLGPVLVSVFGNAVVSPDATTGTGGGTQITFHSTVSNATIGTAPVTGVTGISFITQTALGATKVGPFSNTTKVAKLGKYETWRFAGGSRLAGKTVTIWVAKKSASGVWSAFTKLTSRLADSSGNAFFWWRTSSKAWISARAQFPGDATYILSWSVARQARWL
jgi:hypothetical protein